MTDVVIRHCRLRVVRHGGWSWGAEPRNWLQTATGALPALLASRLAELYREAPDIDVTEPLRIRIAGRPEEILSVLAGPPAPSPFLAELDAALEAGVAEAARRPPPSAALAAEEPRKGKTSPGRRLQRLLQRWREEGWLRDILKRCPSPVLEAWNRILTSELAAAEELRSPLDPTPSSSDPPGGDDLLEELRRAAPSLRREPTPARNLPPTDSHEGRATPTETHEGQTADLHEGQAVPAESPVGQAVPADAFSGQAVPADSPTGQAVPADLAIGRALPRSARRAMRRPPDESAPTAHPAVEPARRGVPAAWPDGERTVASALPLLLLGPLSRIGYLETLAAVLDAADLAASAPIFAQALAFKVLDAPQRGWRRSPESTSAAAVFAGRLEPIPEPRFTAFARQVGEWLAPLEAEIAQSLVADRDAEQPLYLHRLHGGLGGELLFDAEGLFPIAWARSTGELRPLVEKARGPVLRPAGDEAERIDEIVRQLWIERRAVPLAEDSRLEHSLALAAAVALGTLAWTLWHEREAPDPLLALERFATLGAQVRFEARAVRVFLPLGRRRLDLEKHGFLADVPDVPWFNGRRLEFVRV